MKKLFKVVAIIFGYLIGLLALVYIGLCVAKFTLYKDYLAEAENVNRIPALNEGFTPQGITHIPGEEGAYLHSGYNGKYVQVFYVKGDTSREVKLLDEKGDPAKGHAGGITVWADYVYVAGDEALLTYRLSEVLAAKEGEPVSCVRLAEVDNAASFCFAAEGKMYVGEFYRAENYETDRIHAYTTPQGERNRAIVSCYDIIEDGSLAELPDYWLSVPAQVQGFAVHNGVVALSRSWGLNSSYLEFYAGMLDSGKTAPYAEEVPIYYLGSANRIEQLELPAFSEDLDVVDGRVVITYESACNKYIVGKLFFAFDAQSYPIPVLDQNDRT